MILSSARTRGGRIVASLPILLFFITIVNIPAKAQVFELRRVFEQLQSGRFLIGGELYGPVESQLDPVTARRNVDFNVPAEVNGMVTIDYWQLRAGVTVNMLTAIMPSIFWHPVIGNDFGGPGSRWSASIGWEGVFASDADYDPRKNLQPDNSDYTPRNSFSLLVGRWFGKEEGTFRIDTNYAGRGYVDTSNYRAFPLDTATYVRGVLDPTEVPAGDRTVRFQRNGFSAAIGVGTGKYAGSGPISRFLNLFYSQEEANEKSGDLLPFGMNPMVTLRYRYNDYIAHLDVAGEDVNLGLIYRGFHDLDVEVGLKYLEHIYYRPSRGPNRTGLFVGLRYAPFGPEGYENGEEVYIPESDSDGDGIMDGYERTITRSDPNNRDSDGDGLNDGLEVYTYKSNPLVADSDGDGLSDGQELTGQRRTDPLRPDTDNDGMTDGAELSRGTDPLEPAGGERGR